MEVYVWGDGVNVAKFHAESLAITWFINTYFADRQIKIIPNSNIYATQSGILPLLRDSEAKIEVHCFKQIVSYLEKKYGSPVKGKFRSIESSLIHDGLLETVMDKVDLITQYVLYVNKENYEGYTRGLFKSYLPFPLQYTPPLHFKHRALEICAMSGLSTDSLKNAESDEQLQELLAKEKKLRETPKLGTVHESQINSSLDEILQQKNIITNMHCIHSAETVYKDVYKLQKSLLSPTTGRTKYFFGEFISPAEILLYANIFSQCNEDLPSGFMKTYLSKQFSDFIKRSESLYETQSSTEVSKSIGLSYALVSSVYNYF